MQREFLGNQPSIDVKALDQAGRLYQIEIQPLNLPDLPARILYGWADLYSAQLRRERTAKEQARAAEERERTAKEAALSENSLPPCGGGLGWGVFNGLAPWRPGHNASGPCRFSVDVPRPPRFSVSSP